MNKAIIVVCLLATVAPSARAEVGDATVTNTISPSEDFNGIHIVFATRVIDWGQPAMVNDAVPLCTGATNVTRSSGGYTLKIVFSVNSCINTNDSVYICAETYGAMNSAGGYWRKNGGTLVGMGTVPFTVQDCDLGDDVPVFVGGSIVEQKRTAAGAGPMVSIMLIGILAIAVFLRRVR